MAQGPDPNRDWHTDRELTKKEIRQGGGLGNTRSTRLGLSSVAVALIAVVVTVVLVALLW